MSGILRFVMHRFNNTYEFETCKRSMCQFTNNLKRATFSDNT